MNKNTTYILIIVLVSLVAYLMYSKSSSETTTTSVPPPPVPPPPTGNSTQTENSEPILASNEPAKSAIANRMVEIYNSSERESVFARNNTRENIFSGLSYRSGVRTALAQILPSGNADLFPLIPTKINPAYAQKLNSLQDLQSINEFEDAGQFDTGMALWKNAMDMSNVGGVNLWPSNLESLVAAGLFFVSGAADSNMSERYSSYCTDIATLCKNAAIACEQSNSHFESEAKEDLMAAGWNIV